MTCQFHPDMTANDAIERLNAYQEGFSERLSSTPPQLRPCSCVALMILVPSSIFFFRLYLDDDQLS